MYGESVIPCSRAIDLLIAHCPRRQRTTRQRDRADSSAWRRAGVEFIDARCRCAGGYASRTTSHAATWVRHAPRSISHCTPSSIQPPQPWQRRAPTAWRVQCI